MHRIAVSLAILFAIALVPATSLAQGQKAQAQSQSLSLNQQIAQAIADKLSDKYPDYTINVRYSNGIATLGGELYSKSQADEAASYVQSLPGVSKVINQLKVVQQQSEIRAVTVSRPGNNNIAPAVSEPSAPTGLPQPAVAQQPSPVNAITQVSGQQIQGVTDFSQQIPSAPSVSVLTAPAPSVVAPTAPVPMLTSAPTAPTLAQTPAPTVQASYVESPQDNGLSNYDYPFHNNSVSISTSQEMNYGPQPPMAAIHGNMPLPMGQQTPTAGRYDQPNVPNYAWPTYAAPNNYSEVAYPRLYCPQAAPYIGPFYPYPQVPLEWRKVTLEWHDGYWWLDFDDGTSKGPFSPLFRQPNPRRY
ncbi:MAG: BON domain-containing protein [Planctomycetaceae bacterium]|nr:BON domain-containing protein [Planctomycetaceae bacterium]